MTAAGPTRQPADDARPIVVAFDGSAEADAALRAAVSLFGDRLVLVVSVWEPGLSMAMTSWSDPVGMEPGLPSPEQIEIVDRAEREHAAFAAEAGVRLVEELGGIAEARPVADGSNIADTVIAVANERDAAAVVVGSRGLGAVKSKLLGSTSRRLLDHARRPVLVVRGPG